MNEADVCWISEKVTHTYTLIFIYLFIFLYIYFRKLRTDGARSFEIITFRNRNRDEEKDRMRWSSSFTAVQPTTIAIPIFPMRVN